MENDIANPITHPTIPGFRRVPRTGVIYVMHRARQQGFDYENKTWSNLGQGSPETGDLPGAPERLNQLLAAAPTRNYGPVAGELALREQVAALYNKLFRKGKSSQYTYDNVSIAGGGRLSLTRLAAALDDINMGHFLPDYTAYEELLSTFKSFIPIPILLSADRGYQLSAESLRQEILGRGLAALLLSNPCNPTGQVVQDFRLRSWVEVARETRCTLIMDEHYSHFIYNESSNPYNIVTAAQYVDDVENDPIIIIDGLTKNWRYPGFRISWTLGPKSIIETISSAGSFLDGGANHPFQKEACAMLDLDYTLAETAAIQQIFKKKRDYTLERLHDLGITADSTPGGSFYIWANLADLPAPINNGMAFFDEGLKEQVITVPGVFFDVNPGHRRRQHARYGTYARISYGPELEVLKQGLDALERVVKKFR
ncbi:MAG: pyridoxal phosphate-dependent aminotransferase [Chloroflexota bacterium]